MLSAEISEQNEAVRESMDKLATEKENNNKANVVSRQYIHDLYRFYKLWIFRNEQHDIFKDQLDLWKCDTLKPLFNQPERLKQIADHLFAKDYLSEASELYTALSQTLQTDAGIKQKLGFSLQKLKKYQDAVNVYKQADILNPDHAWTLKHMGQCFKHMHEYEQALECFYRAETCLQIQRDRRNIQFRADFFKVYHQRKIQLYHDVFQQHVFFLFGAVLLYFRNFGVRVRDEQV